MDYGEANLADEQADTVRIMSIHKKQGTGISNRDRGRYGKTFQYAGCEGQYCGSIRSLVWEWM